MIFQRSDEKKLGAFVMKRFRAAGADRAVPAFESSGAESQNLWSKNCPRGPSSA